MRDPMMSGYWADLLPEHVLRHFDHIHDVGGAFFILVFLVSLFNLWRALAP